MACWFLNALMLIGLIAVAIPPIIHLLTRRRFDVVDWAAMQFLKVSERTRRKIFLEELLLMMLRMGLIALLVLALAAPFLTSKFFAKWGGRGNRDIVLVFDGSYSMGFQEKGSSAHERAKEWAEQLINDMAPGDRVAILQAKQQVSPILGNLNSDPDQIRTALRNLPPVRGGVDWPAALQSATQILNESNRAQREIIILSDGQRFGWADDSSLLRWELLASKIGGEGTFKPRIWVVNLDPERPENPSNWSLLPIRTSRAVASVGREITFRSALQLHGSTEAALPASLSLEVDGKPAGDVRIAGARLDRGQAPYSFKQRFTTPGSHVVSVRTTDDALPGDNRVDFAVEVVPALPVLLVDGDDTSTPKTRGTDFIRKALAPERDPNPGVLARVISINAFEPTSLTQNLGEEPNTAPRVLILSNITRLQPGQIEAIERFLGDRGGVLVCCGDRVDAKPYNDFLFRAGQGWLPAQLIEPIGAEDDLSKAARPVAASFFHPAVELFRDLPFGGLADARFPKRWKVSMNGANVSTAIAMLTGSEPLLIERPYRNGRVVMSTVPLDNSWRTNLTDMPAFVPLAHELVYYLASARTSEVNLTPGQAIRFQPADGSASGDVEVTPPDGEMKTLSNQSWPFAFEETREPGVYVVSANNQRPNYFVVHGDSRESQLAPTNDDDRKKVVELIPQITYAESPEEVSDALTKGSMTKELWLLVIPLVFAFLLFEVLMTRRMALARRI